LAGSGESWLHRASPFAKWLLLLAVVLVAIGARSPWPLLGAYALLALAAASCRLPVRGLLAASLLPVPLVGLFALSRWDGTAVPPLTIVGKGMITALAGVLVAATTPYPDLLAPATRVLPPVIGDSLVLTYRALFILAARAEALRLAIRARGAFFPRPAPGALPWPARGTSLRRRFDVLATGAGLAVVRSADLSTQLYDVMRLRGYQGRLAPTRPLALRPADWRPALLALGLIALGAGARLVGV
jgi:energy-coupling factor transporter transmembrane protein EcfT